MKGESKGHAAGKYRLTLRGWGWAEIQQLALIGLNSSLHSETCNAFGVSDGVIHITFFYRRVAFGRLPLKISATHWGAHTGDVGREYHHILKHQHKPSDDYLLPPQSVAFEAQAD